MQNARYKHKNNFSCFYMLNSNKCLNGADGDESVKVTNMKKHEKEMLFLKLANKHDLNYKGTK